MTTGPSLLDLHPQRILVRGVNWLGDAVMTTPALLRLRERFPNAHIALLTPEKLRDLWLHHPAIDEIIGFEPGESVWQVARKIRAIAQVDESSERWIESRDTHLTAAATKHLPLPEGEGWGEGEVPSPIPQVHGTVVPGEKRSATEIGQRRDPFDLALVLPNSPRSALESWLARVPVRVGYARPWRNFFLTTAIPPRPGAQMRKRSLAEIKSLVSAATPPIEPAHGTPERVSNSSLSHRMGEMPSLAGAGEGGPAKAGPDEGRGEENKLCGRDEEVLRAQGETSLHPPSSILHPRSFAPSDHQMHHYLHLVAALGANPEPMPPQLVVTPDELKAVAQKFNLAPEFTKGRPLFALNPGAEYGPAKRWPAERFIAAAQEIQKRTNCLWLILGGQGDLAVANQIESQIGNRQPATANVLAGRTSLRELCAVIKLCRLLLTNDTGPMHLAAALGVPVVVPFGSTSPELTGPIASANTPHQLLKSDAPCSPCFLRECPIDFRCMTGITVDQVVDAVMKLAAPGSAGVPPARL